MADRDRRPSYDLELRWAHHCEHCTENRRISCPKKSPSCGKSSLQIDGMRGNGQLTMSARGRQRRSVRSLLQFLPLFYDSVRAWSHDTNTDLL